MKITFKRTGGFANIPVNIEVNTENLTQEKGNQLQQLIAKLLPFKSDVDKSGNDVCQYVLQVEENDKVQVLECSDLTATDEMREVFDLLME